MNVELMEYLKSTKPTKPQDRRWGHMSLVNEWTQPELAVGPDGSYETGVRIVWWELLCDCGNRQELERSTFPGRAKMRTCGGPDCEYSAPGYVDHLTPRKRGRKPGAPHTVFGLYIHNSLLDQVKLVAKQRQLSMSGAINQLLKEAMRGGDVN